MQRSTGDESSSWWGAGRRIDELAREFEPSANAIRQWVRQAALDVRARAWLT